MKDILTLQSLAFIYPGEASLKKDPDFRVGCHVCSSRNIKPVGYGDWVITVYGCVDSSGEVGYHEIDCFVDACRLLFCPQCGCVDFSEKMVVEKDEEYFEELLLDAGERKYEEMNNK